MLVIDDSTKFQSPKLVPELFLLDVCDYALLLKDGIPRAPPIFELMKNSLRPSISSSQTREFHKRQEFLHL